MTQTIHDELATTGGARRATAAGVDRAPGPVPTAFAELADRNDRLEHLLEALASMVDDLGRRLAPVLPELETTVPTLSDTQATPAQVDNRGQVARTISSQARRVDFAADRVATITSRIGRLLDDLEV